MLYPFNDNSWPTIKGTPLPSDFILSLILTVINAKPPIRLSSVGPVIEFSDSSGSIVAYCNNNLGIVQLKDKSDRPAGTIVIGNTSINEDKIDDNTGVILASLSFVVNQPGVRGFRLPNGDIATGDVIFEGRDGVVVTSYPIDGDGNNGMLRFDVVGIPPAKTGEGSSDCDTKPNATKIKLEQTSDSIFSISDYDNKGTIAISLRDDIDYDDICGNTAGYRRPPGPGRLDNVGVALGNSRSKTFEDVCLNSNTQPSTPDPAVPAGESVSITINAKTMLRFDIVPVAPMGRYNAIKVKQDKTAAPAVIIPTKRNMSIDDYTNRATKLSSVPSGDPVIKLSVAGLKG